MEVAEHHGVQKKSLSDTKQLLGESQERGWAIEVSNTSLEQLLDNVMWREEELYFHPGEDIQGKAVRKT